MAVCALWTHESDERERVTRESGHSCPHMRGLLLLMWAHAGTTRPCAPEYESAHGNLSRGSVLNALC